MNTRNILPDYRSRSLVALVANGTIWERRRVRDRQKPRLLFGGNDDVQTNL